MTKCIDSEFSNDLDFLYVICFDLDIYKNLTKIAVCRMLSMQVSTLFINLNKLDAIYSTLAVTNSL